MLKTLKRGLQVAAMATVVAGSLAAAPVAASAATHCGGSMSYGYQGNGGYVTCTGAVSGWQYRVVVTCHPFTGADTTVYGPYRTAGQSLGNCVSGYAPTSLNSQWVDLA